MHLKLHRFLLLCEVFIQAQKHVCIFWINSIADQTSGSIKRKLQDNLSYHIQLVIKSALGVRELELPHCMPFCVSY